MTESKSLSFEALSSRMGDLLPQEIDGTAERYAKIFAQTDKLKTAQLRNFYAAVTRMRTDFDIQGKYADIELDLIMLKPKLAYAAGRQKAVRSNFYPFMKNAIDGVSEAKNPDKAVRNFFLLVESVVAYHKFHGGD